MSQRQHAQFSVLRQIPEFLNMFFDMELVLVQWEEDDFLRDILAASEESADNERFKPDPTVTVDIPIKHVRHRKKCNICIEKVMPKQDAIHLGCGHYFHHKCITDWASRKQTCPTCRAKIPIKNSG